MNFDEVLLARYSCRGYLTDPVDDELLSEVVALAQQAPSWCNSQAWQIDVTSAAATARLSAELLSAITELRPGTSDVAWPERYEGVYAERRRECGYALYESLSIERDDRPARDAQALKNFEFFGAPHVALVTSPVALGSYGLIDCGSFIAHFMLAAQSRGLGSIAQAAPTIHSQILREFFDVAADRQIVCTIAFGFPDPEHPANGFRTSRAPVADVVRHVR